MHVHALIQKQQQTVMWNNELLSNLARLLQMVPRDLELGELVDDEHKRYLLYVDVLTSMPPESEVDLIEIVRSDPDRTMSQAAIVEYLDRTAGRLESASQYTDWLTQHKPQFQALEFVNRRANEWGLLKDLDENAPVDVKELYEASDWLQRKVATETRSKLALEALLQTGRTRRIRAAAAHRLSQLSK
jgi:hypothetical protein